MKKRGKIEQEGYNFAIQYATYTLPVEIEKLFEDDISITVKTYNPYREGNKKYKKLFDKGRNEAIKWMMEENKKISDAQGWKNEMCFDGAMNLDFIIQELIEVADNKEELEKLHRKYSDGVCAGIEFFEKLQVKDYYEV